MILLVIGAQTFSEFLQGSLHNLFGFLSVSCSIRLPAGEQGVYDIPLGVIESVDTPNLFAAGRTADGDRLAGASMRVMGTGIAIGQAAGVAAALTALAGGYHFEQVQAQLRKQGAIIDRDHVGPPILARKGW